MAGLRALATAALYLVLKSNGLRHSKNLPVKFGFSPRTVPANIAKKLLLQRCSKPLLAHFSTSRTNGPRLLSLPKAGTHSPFREKSHTRAHTPKQGCFGWGWYHYPRIVLRGSETLRGQGGRTANFAAFGSWPGVLPKNAESLRNSDALMRVAVPRRRGPAGLRGLFSFLTKLRLVRPIPETSFSSPDAPACAVPAQAAFPLALSRLGAVQGFSVLSLCLTPFLDFGDKKGR